MVHNCKTKDFKTHKAKKMVLHENNQGLLKKLFQFFLAAQLLIVSGSLAGQPVYNTTYQTISFLQANKVHKVGTNGSAVGNVTLYTNVITIGSTQIDCIVRTVALSNAAFSIPGSSSGCPSGTTVAFDYGCTGGLGMSGNLDRFFSPTFNFTAAGSAQFRFEFILGGSYNNTTNTGTPVTLQNVYLNTYDIDGNGGTNSNQFNEFGGFDSYFLSSATKIALVYNSTTELTKFRSTVNTNQSSIPHDDYRIRVQYDNISTFDIVVGAEGSGAAYFMLDFSVGYNWTATPATYTNPVLDLNTSEAGNNLSKTFCSNDVYVTDRSSSANLSNVSTIDEAVISFPSADILDGNNEKLIPFQGTNIALNFAGTGTQTFTNNGVTYKATTSVASSTSRITFTNNTGGSLTVAATERLLDSLRYTNSAAAKTTGKRNFSVWVRSVSLTSSSSLFQVDVNCRLLPVTWGSFTAQQQNKQVLLQWSTVQEQNSRDFTIQHSTDGSNWRTLTTIQAAGNSNDNRYYSYIHQNPETGSNYYRIIQQDIDGRTSNSEVRKVVTDKTAQPFSVAGNPVTNGQIQVLINETGGLPVSLYSTDGKLLWKATLPYGYSYTDVSRYPKGIYLLQAKGHTEKLIFR